MGALRNGKYIGRNIIKFRHHKNWTREVLVAKMQMQGCYMTRDIIADIESCRCLATQKEIMHLAEVFGIRADFFYKTWRRAESARSDDRTWLSTHKLRR